LRVRETWFTSSALPARVRSTPTNFENLLLASLGAATGLLIASWGSRVLVAQISTPANPITPDLSLDWRVLGFTLAITVMTAVMFGIAPALQAARVQTIEAIRTQGRGLVGEDRTRLSSGLVVLEEPLEALTRRGLIAAWRV
jgi:putative ABC transport system permease protein